MLLSADHAQSSRKFPGLPVMPLKPWAARERESADRGTGLQELLSAIDETLRASQGEIEPDFPMLTNARHRQAIEIARLELLQFERAWREENLPATGASV